MSSQSLIKFGTSFWARVTQNPSKRGLRKGLPAMKEMRLSISPAGTITAIYTDELAPLFAGGTTVITRGSHVEPDASGWYADLTPVGGPVLRGFTLRQQALDAEVDYLNTHVL